MGYDVKIGEPKLVFAPEVTEATCEWGVYSIPRMWREPNGDLIVRFNGEKDDGFAKCKAPNLYFKSDDNGENWRPVKGEYDISVLTGINPPYLKLKNGDIIAIRYKKDLEAIGEEVPHIKEYIVPNGANVRHVYRYSDIPEKCKGMEIVRISGDETTTEDAYLNFPDREVALNAKGLESDGTYTKIPVLMQYNIFAATFITGLCELPDGTLAAVIHGQNPKVFDRECEEVYLVASDDGGKNWNVRSVIASDTDKFPHGYSGDGSEISLTVSENGNLVCAMRMEMSCEHVKFFDTMVSVSYDNGYSFCEPFSAADSSVTPHVIGLNGGIVALVYGRPGVHFKVSEDNGQSYGEAYPIIGKTLKEERAAGRDDMQSKYFDTCSYSNTFIEKIDDVSFLVLYNDMKEFDDNGVLRHKAAYVRKITIEKRRM